MPWKELVFFYFCFKTLTVRLVYLKRRKQKHTNSSKNLTDGIFHPQGKPATKMTGCHLLDDGNRKHEESLSIGKLAKRASVPMCLSLASNHQAWWFRVDSHPTSKILLAVGLWESAILKKHPRLFGRHWFSGLQF